MKIKTICTFSELIAVNKPFMEKQLEWIFEEHLNQPYRDYVLKKYKNYYANSVHFISSHAVK